MLMTSCYSLEPIKVNTNADIESSSTRDAFLE